MPARNKGWLHRLCSRTPLRVWIFLSFLMFTVLISGLLWFLEVVLLERFYFSSKISETQQLAEHLMDVHGQEGFENELRNTAVNEQVCISVIDSRSRLLYQADVMDNNCLLHGRGNRMFELLHALEESENGTICLSIHNDQINIDTLVIGCIIGTSEDVQGYIFLNAILEPVDSTVRIIKKLLMLISVVQLVAGAVIAFFLSRQLSRPIVRITESAKRMATGDYTTEFSGGSCLEVEELARTLTRAEYEISRVDAMQRDLIANVSHDLRTPLTMLRAYAEMIRDLSGDNPVKRNAHLQVIIEETDRLTLLVRDILDLSRLENGKEKLDCQHVSVTGWLTDIIGRYSGISDQIGYHISFIPDEPREIVCDPGKLERVVCNLINNAVNYTGEDKQVYVRQINGAGCVRIEVQDTGDGIEEEKLKLIFDKYYRSENHRREIVGTGLGLSIVKAILKLHGCSYGVRSRLGEGSVFWFEIRTQDADNNRAGSSRPEDEYENK